MAKIFKDHFENILRNIIKKNYDIFSEILFANFPEQLKYADILSSISEIYERLLYKQLETYFESILSQYQCGFRKGFSVLTALLPIIEKWRESLDPGCTFEALLTELSKAFDCLPRDLFIAKLHAYGLDMPSLKFYILI